jgi:hypothetical protein
MMARANWSLWSMEETMMLLGLFLRQNVGSLKRGGWVPLMVSMIRKMASMLAEVDPVLPDFGMGIIDLD